VKACPHCAEGILPQATRCPYCGADLTRPSIPAPARASLARWGAAAGVALLLVLVPHQGSFLRPVLDDQAGDLAAVGEVRDLILERWVGEPDKEALRDGALRGLVAPLDPFSDYISPADLASFEERTTGKFGGLGIYITVEDGYVKVIAPIEDTPAWEGGIRPGDVIVQADGEPTPEFRTAAEAVEFLKGEPGTTITLSVIHEGARRTEDITLERAIIQIRSVKGARVVADGVAYIRITSFNSGTVDEFEEALAALADADADMQALVLDLRENPGGYLHAAAQIADAFLAEDRTVVTTRVRGGEVEQDIRSEGERRVAVPVAVLVDGGSASASEILAGALQDHGVATVVGARSYGKGSVQTLIDVMGGAAQLKLTTQYFFTPDGRRIHRGEREADDESWGILPDIRVPLDPARRRRLVFEESEREMDRLASRAGAEIEVEERLHVDDPQVAAAFAHLQRVLAGEEAIGHERDLTPAAGTAEIDSRARAAADPPDREPSPDGEGDGDDAAEPPGEREAGGR